MIHYKVCTLSGNINMCSHGCGTANGFFALQLCKRLLPEMPILYIFSANKMRHAVGKSQDC